MRTGRASQSREADRDPAAQALELDDVSRAFRGRRAVDGVTITVGSGELVALLGPSGSGKTTLLRLIAGFEVPDAGTVTVGGRRVSGDATWVEPERRGIGLVPQGDSLFPHLTVGQNVAFGTRREPHLAAWALDLVGLADRADSSPGELSGGERQRVALARALAPRPSLVLLDEPFSSLDAGLRARLRRDVVEVLQRAGATAMLVTHDQEEALALADRVAVLRDGRIVQNGGPADVYWRPADLWTARFLGEVNVLAAVIDASGAATALGQFATPDPNGRSGRCAVGVRPEALFLVAHSAADAAVVRREFRGRDVRYEVRHPVIGTVVVQTSSVELFEPGVPVTVAARAGASAAILDGDDVPPRAASRPETGVDVVTAPTVRLP